MSKKADRHLLMRDTLGSLLRKEALDYSGRVAEDIAAHLPDHLREKYDAAISRITTHLVSHCSNARNGITSGITFGTDCVYLNDIFGKVPDGWHLTVIHCVVKWLDSQELFVNGYRVPDSFSPVSYVAVQWSTGGHY